jgi:hypothetical protein
MIHSSLNESTPCTEIPSWKNFDYDDKEVDETMLMEENQAIPQEQTEEYE